MGNLHSLIDTDVLDACCLPSVSISPLRYNYCVPCASAALRASSPHHSTDTVVGYISLYFHDHGNNSIVFCCLFINISVGAS